MNRNGVSLLEVLIAGALTAALLVGIVGYLTRTGRLTEAMARGQADDLNLLQASRAIVHLARLAGGTGCERPAAGTLQCRVDRTMPATGALRDVRFTLVGGSLQYQENNGGVWVVRQTFPGIDAFDICTPAEIAAGTCPLEARGMNRAFGSVATGDLAYFRFRLRRPVAPGTPAVAAEIQSGFFARNTARLAPGLAYQWGGVLR